MSNQYLKQNLRQIIEEIYGHEKIEEFRQQYTKNTIIRKNIENYSIHIDSYIIGSDKGRLKVIAFHGLCGPFSAFHVPYPNEVMKSFDFDQLLNLKIHFQGFSDLPKNKKMILIDAVFNPTKMFEFTD